MSTKAKSRTRKPIPFSALRQKYAKDHELDVSVASKRLRAKMRNAYGKNDVVTKYVDRKGENRDGNRYADATLAEAKVILSL